MTHVHTFHTRAQPPGVLRVLRARISARNPECVMRKRRRRGRGTIREVVNGRIEGLGDV